MTLALVFVLLFLIAFAVVVLMLRVPAEQRAIERRLTSLQPSAAFGGIRQGAERLFKDKPSPAVGAAAWLEQLRPARLLQQLVFQSTGDRSIVPLVLSVVLADVTGTAVVFFITDMAAIATLAGVLLGMLPVARLYRIRGKRLAAFELALPECIDMCARALRAGHSLTAAIGLVAEDAPEPAKSEFGEIFRKQNYGLSVRDSFSETLERLPSADFRVFVTGILVQKDTGGNLTEVFDRIVTVIRERIRIQGEIRVHTAQGRLTGWILTLLPAVLLIVINLMNPGYSKLLLTDPTGKKLMYAGIVFLLIGGTVIRRIVNGIEV